MNVQRKARKAGTGTRSNYCQRNQQYLTKTQPPVQALHGDPRRPMLPGCSYDETPLQTDCVMDRDVGKGDEMEESSSQLNPDSGETRETYAEDRRRRLHRGRMIGFALCITLWVLSVIPLARESMHGREGARAVGVIMAVGAITLGVAAVIRGAYVLLRKLPFWSPWVFLLAAVLALVGYSVQSAGPGGLISAPQAESRAAGTTTLVDGAGGRTTKMHRAGGDLVRLPD